RRPRHRPPGGWRRGSHRPPAECDCADHRRGEPSALPARRRRDSRRSLRAADRSEVSGADVVAHRSKGQTVMNNPLVQLDPGLYIWTIVVFLVLLGLLARFAWKPLLEALEARQELIRRLLDDAEKAKQELDRMQ